MGPVLLALFGFACGIAVIYFPLDARRRRLAELEEKLARQRDDLEDDRTELEADRRRLRADREEFGQESRLLQTAQAEFSRRLVSYDELAAENLILKADVRNMGLAVARQNFEQRNVRADQLRIETLANDIGHRYLSETQAWVSRSLTETNYVANRKRLEDAIARCRAVGVTVTAHQEADYLARLQREYEEEVRKSLEREAQAQARARMKEDQQRLREQQQAEAEKERAEAEKRAVEAALARAMQAALGKHSDEVNRLQQQLADAQQKLDERTEKAVSLAQLTKVGHVYVISNIGSFGDGVFKIGMTRRLVPMERVIELGDASVPFPFDVHMMIRTEDAPELEHRLHKRFAKQQLNKVNPRKEFFRVDIEDILQAVQELHGEVTYTITPDASQFRQSQELRPEDEAFIERTQEKVRERMPANAFLEE